MYKSRGMQSGVQVPHDDHKRDCVFYNNIFILLKQLRAVQIIIQSEGHKRSGNSV